MRALCTSRSASLPRIFRMGTLPGVQGRAVQARLRLVLALAPPPSRCSVQWRPYYASSYTAESVAPWGELPHFSEVDANKVQERMRHLSSHLTKAHLEPVEALDASKASWESVIDPLVEMEKALELAWSPVTHLAAVKNTPELRTAAAETLPLIVDLTLRVQQSRPLYNLFKALLDKADELRLDDAQRRILSQRIKAAELSGIALEGDKKERFNIVARRLSSLGKTFGDNVLDATKDWSMVVDLDKTPSYAVLRADLPETLLRSASEAYNASKEPSAPSSTSDKGPWKFTLDAPSFTAFIENASVRALRERIYLAFVSRCSEGPYDNGNIVCEMLRLRQEQAELLGLHDYSEVSLAVKMAGKADAVYEMLERLRVVSVGAAKAEHDTLSKFAFSLQRSPLQHWDVPYFAKKQREALYQYNEEEIRAYLPFERVCSALFSLVEMLLGVRVKKVDDGSIPKWDDEVSFYLIYNNGEQGPPIAGFYLDPYARPHEKRGGAWMDVCRTRLVDAGVVRQIPVAHLVCNGSRPTGNVPSLMTFREVETLFHEFGHGLQHMLTQCPYYFAAGISGIEWDAVELPSQFMENWCYHEPTFTAMARHYKTGEPLPKELFERIRASRTFRAGTRMVRQLRYALMDLDAHVKLKDYTREGVRKLVADVTAQTDVLPLHDKDHPLYSFNHLFGGALCVSVDMTELIGGYECGYYSYKWAEVLSADAFAVFKAHLDSEEHVKKTGRRYRATILAQGGGQDPLTVFRNFKGTDPNPRSLLEQEGLLKEGEL